MGSSTSKLQPPPLEDDLKAKLESICLSSKPDFEKDYIYVDSDSPPKYAPYTQDVSIEAAEEWGKELLKDPKNRLALSALSSHNANSVLTSRATKIADTQTFNIKIPLEGAPVTNQRSSGRCWLFASTNVFRVAFMRKYNLKEFQLSQSYLFFWDKLEKANYFLEQILDTVDEELDGRLVQELLSSPVGDGGQWDMVANLVEKYGLVPESLYPDSYNATSSSLMGNIITTKLREDALILRKLASNSAHPQSSIGVTKAKMLQEIHSILTIMLGPPPSPKKAFTWEYIDKNDKFHSVSATPLEYASSLASSDSIRANGGTNVHELFSLVNDPRNKYGELLTVSRLGNVHGGRGITYANVPMDTLKKACISMLKSGIPVFFGSDVGQYSNSTDGIMDPSLIDYELAFNIKLGLTKAQRLKTKTSQMTHAMVLTAVHVVDGQSVRWRVENSWGPDAGSHGYFVMSDKWMDEFVYQVVVDPRFVSKDVKSILDKDPVVLPLWDPMGALA